MHPQLKRSLTAKTKWLRLLHMILFGIAFRLADWLLMLLAVLQFMWVLFKDEPHEQLLQFGESLGLYLQQLAAFLSYNSELKPFPFSAWPEANPTPVPVASAVINNDEDDDDINWHGV